MGLEANVGLTIVAHESDTEVMANVFRVTSVNRAFSYADGTGASQAQLCWGITATVGTSGVTYNMASLPDGRGNVTVTSTKVCYVRNLSDNVHITLGGLSFGTYPVFPSVGVITVHEGGDFLAVAPDADGYDSSGSALNAQIKATAGTAAFQFIIVGEGTAP